MADIEKILNGFRHCFPETEEDGLLNCDDCPYEESCSASSADVVSMPTCIFEDVYELLKEQQPRVLSKREVYDLSDETDVWCEQRDSKRVAAMTTLGEKYFMHTPLFAMGLESNDIRFWTKRPTEEQRKAVPWETN